MLEKHLLLSSIAKTFVLLNMFVFFILFYYILAVKTLNPASQELHLTPKRPATQQLTRGEMWVPKFYSTSFTVGVFCPNSVNKMYKIMIVKWGLFHRVLQQLRGDHSRVMSSERTSFASFNDVIGRLLPYHVFQGSPPQDEDFTKGAFSTYPQDI